MTRWRRNLTCIVLLSSAALIAADFNGLSGLKLKRAIAETCRPTSYTTDIISNLTAIDSVPTDNAVIGHWAAASWWTDSNRIKVQTDLHNLFITSPDIVAAMSDFAPGNIETITFSNDFIYCGYTGDGTNAIGAYQPRPDKRGDVARTIFYLSTVYHCSWWNGSAINILTDSEFPGLNASAREVLIKWHREDKISDEEKKRNNAISRLQGTTNPFIDNPELAEFLWGNKTGQVFISTEIHNRQPLRAIYSQTDDEYIDLYSPYIPTDASWLIDGNPSTNNSVKTQSLAIGRHELHFSSGSIRGRITIEIR